MTTDSDLHIERFDVQIINDDRACSSVIVVENWQEIQYKPDEENGMRISRFIFLIAILVNGTLAFMADAKRPEPGWRNPPENNPRFTVYDMPLHEIEETLGISPEEMMRRQTADVTDFQPVRSDTGVALILLCQWQDDMADTSAHPREAFETLLFSEDTVDPGSLREYFTEISYGNYKIGGEVHGWYTQPTYIQNLWFTDFFAQADADIDYSRFDHDGNGYTDAIWVFHAGPGEEESHDPDDIWSFALSGLDYMTEDGVIIDRFACCPEEHVDGSIHTIRVVAHEASHVLGLPDLYDYDGKLDTTTFYTPGDVNDHPVVDWCVMGYAGYGVMSYGTFQDPSHQCAWSKTRLGFLEPVIINESRHHVPLPEVELNPVVYKIKKSTFSHEYFLIENRNSNSDAKFDHMDSDFSAYFPWFSPGQNIKDPGMIIYHVDDAVSGNTRGPNNPHYMVRVEDAGYDPDRPWDGISEYSEWWYPYEFRIGAAFAAEDSGQDRFTPTSTPNSDWYNGPSYIWITNISESGARMTFDIGFDNAWPAIVDHDPSQLDTLISPRDTITFTIETVDHDGDELLIEWYEGDDVVLSGSGMEFTYMPPAGTNNEIITAVATDGELADTLSWHIRVDTGVVADESPKPRDGSMLVLQPVPFTRGVTIRYGPAEDTATNLEIYDLSGRMIAKPFPTMTDDELVWFWDAKDRSGYPVSSGVYIVRLSSGETRMSRRIVYAP